MVKWIIRLIKLLAVFLLILSLSYNLPTRDIVQIVGTDVKRMDIPKGAWGWDKPDSGTSHNDMRDVRFINAVKANSKPMVYRNEDTDFGWPPYFKFDSGDLNAQAQEYAKQTDKWVSVTNFGWRMQIFSIYPNAVKIKPVSGPNVFLFPWFNVIFISVLVFLYLWFRRWARLFFTRKKPQKS